jgi:hypothetical protein
MDWRLDGNGKCPGSGDSKILKKSEPSVRNAGQQTQWDVKVKPQVEIEKERRFFLATGWFSAQGMRRPKAGRGRASNSFAQGRHDFGTEPPEPRLSHPECGFHSWLSGLTLHKHVSAQSIKKP